MTTYGYINPSKTNVAFLTIKDTDEFPIVLVDDCVSNLSDVGLLFLKICMGRSVYSNNIVRRACGKCSLRLLSIERVFF